MADDPELERQGHGIDEVLQTVEDALVDTGWTEIIVRCRLGVWEWHQTHKADGTPLAADEGPEASK